MTDFAQALAQYRRLVIDMDGDGIPDGPSTPIPSRQMGEQQSMSRMARSGLYDRPERTQVADRVSEMAGGGPNTDLPQTEVQQFARGPTHTDTQMEIRRNA